MRSAKLYGPSSSGQYEVLPRLGSVPNNAKDYFVRVESDRFKDVLIPVDKIEETTKDGKEVYKVTAKSLDLVQGNSGYEDNYVFYVEKIKAPNGNVYYSFTDLVKAIEDNPSGVFQLGSNLDARDITLAKDAFSYITKDFTGRLIGVSDSSYAIFNLKAPLFNKLAQGSKIQKIDLKNVDIQGGEDVGALAKYAVGTQVRDVAVEGNIVAKKNVGGLVFEAKTKSSFVNVSYKGKITTSSQDWSGSNVGGLVGKLNDNGSLQKSFADVDITVNQPDNKAHRVAGLVGEAANGTQVKDVYAKGTITNIGKGGYTAGLVASTWYNGSVDNAVSYVKVNNGNKIYGDPGALGDTGIRNKLKNIFAVAGVSSGTREDEKFKYSEISEEEANSKVTSMGITVTARDTSDETFDAINKHTTNYKLVSGYNAANDLAYKNLEKLLPFYNKEIIVSYGNKVKSDDKLNRVEVLSILPMNDTNLVESGISSETSKILIHYADGTSEYRNITDKKLQLHDQIAEYKISGTELIYTPNQIMTNNYKAIVDATKDLLTGIDLYSDEVIKFFGLENKTYEMPDAVKKEREQALKDKNGHEPTAAEKAEDQLKYNEEQKVADIKRLYFEEIYDILKDNIENHLTNILKNSANILNTPDAKAISNYLEKYIKDNKKEILFGSLYMARYYGIDFGDVNLREIMLYSSDFYGKENNSLDRLVKIGSQSREQLLGNSTATTYMALADFTKQDNLLSFLDYNRTLFTKMDKYDWFKDATKNKVIIVEVASKEAPNAEYKVYDRLSKTPYLSYILPLLNLRDGKMFITSNMSTITFGSNDKRDVTFDKLTGIAQNLGERQAAHLDMWYRLSDEKVKNRLIQEIALPTWDGYVVPTTWEWFGEFGENPSKKKPEAKASALREFFGPVGKYYYKNASGAYANGSLVHFVVDDVATDYGMSVWTHEMTHNYDGKIYLDGYGRRDGMGAEEFALGMFQSLDRAQQGEVGFNSILTFDTEARTANKSLDRFKTRDDLKEYAHGMYDVKHVLDYLEGEVLISKGTDAMKSWYNVVDQVADGKNVNEKLRPITDEEVAKIKTVDDMITGNLITKRYYKFDETHRNGYYTIDLVSPIYGAGENKTGSPGGLIFKDMAYEMLANYGFENGMLGYVSNKLKDSAKADGVDFSDSYIIKKVSNNKYQSLVDFKKDMFKERVDKLSKLKTITVKGQEIKSADDIKKLLLEAVDKDLASKDKVNVGNHNKSEVFKIKQEIYRQYLLLTDDFRTSIFND